MKRDFSDLLQKSQLHVTAPRLTVLEVISKRKVATSQPFLEKNINKDIDRVTLYRTLKTFEEKGILHKVIDLNGTANYAMCGNNCTAGHHHDEHFHFNCVVCEELYCMNELHLPALKLPAHFTATAVNMLISGTCASCTLKKENK